MRAVKHGRTGQASQRRSDRVLIAINARPPRLCKGAGNLLSESPRNPLVILKGAHWHTEGSHHEEPMQIRTLPRIMLH